MMRLLAASGTDRDPKDAMKWVGMSTLYALDLDTVTGKLAVVGKLPNAGCNTMYGVVRKAEEGWRIFVVEMEENGVQQVSMDHAGAMAKVGGVLPTGGKSPCHIADGQDWFAVAHYEGGVALVADHGVIATASPASKGSTGEGRQEASHPHMALPWKRDRLLVCDLGADVVVDYRVEEGKALVAERTVQFPVNTGPRHAAVRGSHAYVVGELNNTVSVVDLDKGDVVQTVSSLWDEGLSASPPFDFYTAPSHAAAIVVIDDHLYVTNRGEDTVVCFGFEGVKLRKLSHVKTPGRLPWTIAAAGKEWVVVAAQFSPSLTQPGTVAVYKRDCTTGALMLNDDSLLPLPNILHISTCTM